MSVTNQLTRILVVFGGESSEHDVSIASVRNVLGAMSDQKYQIHLAYITRQGEWRLVQSIDDTAGVMLTPLLGKSAFQTADGNEMAIDVILPILHGKNGEDGSIQGLAQLLHVPIVGCNLPASAICMDKVATKEVLDANRMLVTPYEIHRRYDAPLSFSRLSAQLGSPMFIKPARAGSSVGVSKVNNEEELVAALELAHQHDDVVLIERGIVGRELEVAVLGNPPYHQISGVGEIIPGEDFYSYNDKYSNSSASQAILSADLEESVRENVRQQAARIYEILGCKGLARVDFFLTSDGTLYLNEVNTLPGFTNASMYPKLWAAEGIDCEQLIDRLITLAIDATIE